MLTTKDSEIECLQQANSDLDTTVSEYNTQLEKVTRKLKDAEEQVSALQADLSLELKTHTNELESFERLSERLNTTTTQLEEVQLAKKDLSIRCNELQAKNESQQTKLENLERTNTDYEQNIQNLTENYQEASTRLEELLQGRELDASTVNEMQESINSLKEDKERLIQEQDNLKHLVNENDREKKSLTGQISKLAHDLEILQSTHLEATNLVNHKHTQYISTKEQLEQLQASSSNLENSLEKCKQQLAQVKKQETLAKQKLVTLKQDLTTSFETQLEKVSEQLNESESTNRELQSQLTAVTAELEEQSMKQISVYAGDNCYHLYVAKHAYDPSLNNDSNDSLSSSPAKSADRSGADSALSATERISDISVNPGDYVFVSGDLTEEGFYEGHLLDGRAGLIPSNVLEPLYEFDIYGFVIASEPAEDADVSTGVMSEFSSTMFNDSNLLPSTPRPSAPYPRNLTLDRQFANGILVGWDCPEGNG